MRRLFIALVMTGCVLAMAVTSKLGFGQFASPPVAAAKKATAPAGAQENVGVAKKEVTIKDSAKKAVEEKLVDTVRAKEVVVKKAIDARKRRVAVNVNANLNGMIQQYVQQGRPLMRSQVLLVQTLHHLSKDQLRVLLKGAEAALETVAKEMAEYQQGGAPRIAARGQAAKNPDWATKLQENVGVEFKKHLTPEQFARYQSEVEKRAAERKEVGLHFLVDAIDRELLLSPRQREQLLATLGPKWDEGWAMYLEYIMYGNQFFPQDVDRLVTPVLDETQKKVWQGAQKVSGFWGFGGLWGFQNAEDPLQQFLDEGQEKPAEKAVIPQRIMQKRGFLKALRKEP